MLSVVCSGFRVVEDSTPMFSKMETEEVSFKVAVIFTELPMFTSQFSWSLTLKNKVCCLLTPAFIYPFVHVQTHFSHSYLSRFSTDGTSGDL